MNDLRELLGRGQVVLNGWLSADSAYLAEVLSHSGFDAVTVDVQHGMYDLGGAVALLQGVGLGPAVPLARPSRLDAITVDINPEETEKTVEDWEKLEIPVPLTVLASPYRETITPIMDYIKTIRRESPRDLVVVYIPEYVVGKWWEQLVHNQTALRIKTRLHFESGVMVASVPWQLKSSEEAHNLQELR